MNDLRINQGRIGELVTTLTRLIQSTGKDYRVTIKEWHEKRSLTANAQYHVWLPTIAKFYGEDVEHVRRMLKHDIAWPILERGGCDYSIKMRYMLGKSGYYQLTRDQQIAMIDMFGVTRFMNTKQHNALRDETQAYWGKQGLYLEYKEKGGK